MLFRGGGGGGACCFPLVKSVYWGLFVRLGSGDEVGDTQGSQRNSNSHGNSLSGRGARGSAALQIPGDGKKRECEHKEGKRRQNRAREAFCLSALDKTKTTHSSGFMPDFLFINKLLAVKPR